MTDTAPRITLTYSGPETELSKDAENAVLQRVRDIVARGNVAVFTRPHQIIPSIPVVKIVGDPTVDEDGDLVTIHGDYVAPWDAAYAVTEMPLKEALKLPL